MRETLFFSGLLLACSVLCADAQGQQFGPYSLTGTQCLSVPVQGKATAALQATGSWSGTLQPKVSVDGQPVANTQVTPAASISQQATITGNGAFTAGVSGYSFFFLCGNTITGTAKIYVNVSLYVH